MYFNSNYILFGLQLLGT